MIILCIILIKSRNVNRLKSMQNLSLTKSKNKKEKKKNNLKLSKECEKQKQISMHNYIKLNFKNKINQITILRIAPAPLLSEECFNFKEKKNKSKQLYQSDAKLQKKQ